MAARSVCALQDTLVAAARHLRARNDDARLLRLLLALRLLLGRRRRTRLSRTGFGLWLGLRFGLGLRLRLLGLRLFRLRLLRSGFLRSGLRLGRSFRLRGCFGGSRFRFRRRDAAGSAG